MLNEFKKPEYLHVLTNPLPIYGMTIGALVLCGALIAESREAQLAGEAVVAFIGLATWLVVLLGEKAYVRVHSISSSEERFWIDRHSIRAERLKYLFYFTAILAISAFVLTYRGSEAARELNLLSLAFSWLCVGASGWIAYAGGKIRHPEFRRTRETRATRATRIASTQASVSTTSR